MDSRYDVVIVGARVAGASTALTLARAGARVALLDRSGYGSDTTSTHGLMRAGVYQLWRLGVLDDVVRAGTPEVRHTLFHYAGQQSVQISIKPGLGVPALYAPRRQVIDKILVDAAAEAGVDVRHGVRVTGSVAEGGRVSGVGGIGPDGKDFEVGAGFVIGADGVRSVVADSVGASIVRQGKASSAVLYRYYADLPVAGYEWAYGLGGAAGMIPTNDGLTCVLVATTPERMRHLRRGGSEAAFEALLDLAAPEHRWRVDQATAADRLHGWSGWPGFLRQPWGPGWALVGDAGYFKDPITAHGMTDALRDAELLSVALLTGWSGGAPEASVLASYQARRDSLSVRLFEATEKIADYDWNLPGVQRLLREVSSAMTDELEVLQGSLTSGAIAG